MITARVCTYDDRARYNELEGDLHYMGESHGSGDTLRLIFEEDGEWVALQTWTSACYRLGPRDERIGWSPAMRALRQKLIVSNRRFTILVPRGSRPNLASQVLALGMRTLPRLWKEYWGYEPLLAETFCDIAHTSGTCYRAAGWELVGETRGFSRVRSERGMFVPNESPKAIYMREFVRGAFDLIASNRLPKEYEAAAHSDATGVLPFGRGLAESLHWAMCRVAEGRAGNRSFGPGTILSLYVLGVAAGAGDLKSAVAFARRLPGALLSELGCPRERDALGNAHPWRRSLPSYGTFYHFLRRVDRVDLATRLDAWTEENARALPRRLAAGGELAKLALGLLPAFARRS